MLITLLKSKIHKAKITSTEIDYVGSIAVCPKMMAAVGMLVNEKVHVLNFENGNRFETYIIEGKEGEIGLRGPAARLGKIGDCVIILSYALFKLEEASSFKPKIVFISQNNQIQNKQ